MDKFADNDVSSLPYVDVDDPTRPIGLITRSDVLRRYNDALEEN